MFLPELREKAAILHLFVLLQTKHKTNDKFTPIHPHLLLGIFKKSQAHYALIIKLLKCYGVTNNECIKIEYVSISTTTKHNSV